MHNVKPAEYDTIFGEDRAYRALLEAKEAGKIGGMLTARKKKLKKQEEENKGNDSEDESI